MIPRLPLQPDEIRLLPGAADDLGAMPNAFFDAVILNGVAQYFPTIDYVLRVLEGMLQTVKPGGCIMIGDVRHFGLHRAFHTSVQLFQADAAMSCEQLDQLITNRVVQEKELLLDPRFFALLPSLYPQIERVEIRLKRGQYHNEMMRFRYNVLLHIREPQQTHVPAPLPLFEWHDWQHKGFTLESLRAYITAHQAPALAFSRIPNARVLADVKAQEWLTKPYAVATVGALRPMVAALTESIGVDPWHLWQLGEELGYDVTISWSAEALECIDAVFIQRNSAEPTLGRWGAGALGRFNVGQNIRHYANNPFQTTVIQDVPATLRAYLETRLPAYMIPATFVLIDTFPLTPNGKIDRQALPAPEWRSVQTTATVLPRTPIETTLAAIWCDLLTLQTAGRA